MSIIGELRCGMCHHIIDADESVILSEINTVMHDHCFVDSREHKKDSGRFDEVVEKYDFFRVAH